MNYKEAADVADTLTLADGHMKELKLAASQAQADWQTAAADLKRQV